jgi:hypothetical protein
MSVSAVSHATCDVVERQQPGRRVDRFTPEDVEAGSGEVAGLQQLGERDFVDDAATAGVEQHGAPLHQGEALAVQESARLAGERQVDRHDVGRRQEVVERQADPVGYAAMVDHVRAHRLDDRAEAAGDVAVADEADRLAGDLAELLWVRRIGPPGARTRRAVEGRDPAEDREEQAQRHLGDGGCVDAGKVGDGDAALAGGVDVDRVHADAELLDQRQLRRPVHALGRDGFEHVEQRLGVGQRGEECCVVTLGRPRHVDAVGRQRRELGLEPRARVVVEQHLHKRRL